MRHLVSSLINQLERGGGSSVLGKTAAADVLFGELQLRQRAPRPGRSGARTCSLPASTCPAMLFFLRKLRSNSDPIKITLLKVDSSVVFSVVTVLCSCHHDLIPERFRLSRKSPVSASRQPPAAPPSARLWICLLWTFHVRGIRISPRHSHPHFSRELEKEEGPVARLHLSRGMSLTVAM